MSGFNPRTRTGCDAKIKYPSMSPEEFQSTHPHGVRQQARVALLNLEKFQSTHPHGVRLTGAYANAARSSVSIHAPARGATLAPPFSAARRRRFNPRTRTGCDWISSIVI